MSLLLDALRHAERAKHAASGESRAPSPAAPSAPAGRGDAPPELQLAILEERPAAGTDAPAGEKGGGSGPVSVGAPSPAEAAAKPREATAPHAARGSARGLPRANGPWAAAAVAAAAFAATWLLWPAADGPDGPAFIEPPAGWPTSAAPASSADATGEPAQPAATEPLDAQQPPAAREAASVAPSAGTAGQRRTAAEQAPRPDAAREQGPPAAPTRADAPAPPRTEPAMLSIRQSRQADSLGAAWEALRAGDLALAERLYRDTLAGEPRQVDALLGLATVAEWRGDAAAAAAGYRAALVEDPANAFALAALARIGREAGPETESWLRSMIAERPAAPLHFALGNLLAADQRWADAQVAFFDAASAAPDNADYAFNLAVALERIGQPRAAARSYRRALELAAAGSPAAFDLAATATRVGALDQAVP